MIGNGIADICFLARGTDRWQVAKLKAKHIHSLLCHEVKDRALAKAVA